MIDKKVVPEGMLDAAMRASMEAGLGIGPSTELRVVLEAALRWQKENPPVPTDDFVEEVIREHSRTNVKWSCVEWVRRMYDAPEPEVDRIDFYVKTPDGYVPWTPTEAQKDMLNLIVPEPVDESNVVAVLENRVSEYSEWIMENLSRASRNEELLPRLKWDKTNRKPFTYGDFFRGGKKAEAK